MAWASSPVPQAPVVESIVRNLSGRIFTCQATTGDALAVVADRTDDARQVRPVVVVGGPAGFRRVVDDVGAVEEVVGVGRVDVAGQVRVAGVDARVEDRHRHTGRPGLDAPGPRRRDVVARRTAGGPDQLTRVRLAPTAGRSRCRWGSPPRRGPRSWARRTFTPRSASYDADDRRGCHPRWEGQPARRPICGKRCQHPSPVAAVHRGASRVAYAGPVANEELGRGPIPRRLVPRGQEAGAPRAPRLPSLPRQVRRRGPGEGGPGVSALSGSPRNNLCTSDEPTTKIAARFLVARLR